MLYIEKDKGIVILSNECYKILSKITLKSNVIFHSAETFLTDGKVLYLFYRIYFVLWNCENGISVDK